MFNTQPLPPVYVMDVFPDMQAALLDLLESLSPEEWQRATVCPGWSVKDIALHLLADTVNILSRQRDGLPSYHARDWDDLVQFINAQNDLWVRATRRLSTRVLCDLLRPMSEQMMQHFAAIDPLKPGAHVDWAGPDEAGNWLEIAREYTEFWVHQQQIRDADNKPGLKERRFFAPLLNTFVRALPVTYRQVDAAEGTLVALIITGEGGGTWHLLREKTGWRLYQLVDTAPSSVVTLSDETAWRLFTKGITREAAMPFVTFEGDTALGARLLDTVSIIA